MKFSELDTGTNCKNNITINLYKALESKESLLGPRKYFY